MEDLSIIEEKEIVIDSRQVSEWTGKEHKNILRDISKEIEELGEIGKLIFEPTSYTDVFNRSQPCYKMNRDGVMQLALKYDAVVRYKVIQKLNELEKKESNEIDISKLPKELRMFNQLFNSLAQTHLETQRLIGEVDNMKQSFVEVKDLLADREDNWREYTKKLMDEAIKKINGTNMDYARFRNESYELLQKRAKCNLPVRVKNMKLEAMKNGNSQTKVKNINPLDVIDADKKLQEIYISIVKELKIKWAN